MQPSHLFQMLKKGYMVAFISSVVFALLGFSVAYGFGFNTLDSLIVGASTMFSSTIIGIKLLPTTVLHHKQTGELVVGLLLLQDLLAIILLTLLTTLGQQYSQGLELSLTTDLFLSLGALPLLAWLAPSYGFMLVWWLHIGYRALSVLLLWLIWRQYIKSLLIGLKPPLNKA